ncbi:vitelline envelope sperm lysin receptor [Patella vulgata]|uniref:vitelline envelope sperm lysin receptor n=1 Tax=Patella vulgata TaxID=6465 RepID=UPI0021803833|nr:vitelline envelope sperm lysin receptor [Patella vulgata]
MKFGLLVLLSLTSTVKVYGETFDVPTTGDTTIRIESVCAKAVTGLSTITVTSDRDVDVTIVCKNNFLAKPQATDHVHYKQDIVINRLDKEPCKFNKKDKSNVYTVEVFIGDVDKNAGASLQKMKRDFLLTCTYDENGNSVTSVKNITNESVPYVEISKEFGGKIKSNISLQLSETSGRAVTSPVPLGKSLRIVARISGQEYVRAMSCVASNGVLNHTILTGGCGDGIVFSKKSGFKTFGKVVYSPYFSSFRLRGNPTLVFSCKFSSCDKKRCDGNSCLRTRTKREIEGDEGEIFTVHSNRLTVEKTQKKPVMISIDAKKNAEE